MDEVKVTYVGMANRYRAGAGGRVFRRGVTQTLAAAEAEAVTGRSPADWRVERPPARMPENTPTSPPRSRRRATRTDTKGTGAARREPVKE